MSPSAGFATDREFAERFMPNVQRIFLSHLGEIAQISAASDHEDMRHATDLVVTISRGDIAVRVRRPDCRWRDLTLRYRRLVAGTWHVDFEVEKILAGFARWYFYGWTEGAEPLLRLGDWMIVDLNEVRASGLIEDAIDEGREQINDDRCTSFIWLTFNELHGIDALVANDIVRTPSRREIMRGQIPAAIARVEARGLPVDINSVAAELGGIARAGWDRDLPALWRERGNFVSDGHNKEAAG